MTVDNFNSHSGSHSGCNIGSDFVSHSGSHCNSSYSSNSVSHSEKETIEFASTFASTLKNGTVVILDGELGAGKTVFVKGVALGLKIKDNVKSPTYVIANSYNNGRFNHIDAYRLKNIDDFETLGIDFDNSISLIEWGYKYKEYFKNNNTILVKLNKDKDNENIRYINILTIE
jgi:tRNA threonylcarbamoyladenosine biosynthesis protein TsaE